MHLKDNFTRELEENVSLILAVGIDSYLQFSKQAMLFHASVALSVCAICWQYLFHTTLPQ